ncbi:FAD-dependent urate hydroxylase [Elasticomyces elasticus]|uniref:FAD-dependent urate hydroxylase n=1 Tax=Exophiala sideris TaxID=1016849 RepID=A0ABR0JA83_9EURO|nr:FAD-dependent urate hydroxylase [Elasticomyces elasticus]KAK5026095.1 FAD-dependent urate hydroxylase [Exophiala sideris]KAK5032350.1 FAD-dependent urate hydroxylase [Exophiala sideris]KAK5059505.1 FAD-dependent urate hydroxylase [Exophiala sideris]KAK5186668.1 FAD-dependent urate hydroxylase [Eurotiomycetes sp. CCFEE 6388]
MRLHGLASVVLLVGHALWATAYYNDTSPALIQEPFYQLADGCPPCPRCFDCHYDEFKCLQYANCSNTNGKCVCPPGFGGDDCAEPLCGSLADGKNRSPRKEDKCDCKEGWEGVNCNVCTSNNACNALMPLGQGGVCYKQGVVVHENFQMCNVTNKAILDQIDPRIPQVTFSCNADQATCNFQFWVDHKESFYCALDNCTSEAQNTNVRNSTKYTCENVKCSCIADRFLCGEDGSVNIDEFLEQEIKGPASFYTQHTYGGSSKDGSRFEEPAMNNLISMIFGDEYISLGCRGGECLYETEIPGYSRPVKEINTPLIAGVIAGCALFVVAVILISWYLSHRAAYRRWGAIRLGEGSDDDAARAMINHTPMALQFENLSYNLKGKEIISGISGIAHPGQVTAIMGASGAGKSTFLDILARKNKRGTVLGNMYVNGEKILDTEYRNVIGFVDQEDSLLPTLTVHETIQTSALLRLPADMGLSVKEQRVIEVMQQLGIYHIKDQLIGSEEGNGRGISGGEKRRVGIACELVTSPSILFLDEPTSGLDAFNAFNVVECLVTLAKTYNRTVIFTIHQPRSNIVALFDQLILLAKGRTVYSGPFSSCQAYFDHIGYTCPPGFNIADYLVDLTMHASLPRSPMFEDAPKDFPERDGVGTESSSTRAVKSIASVSNVSMDGPHEAPTRIKPKRRVSLKQKQDRQLFTRKRTGQDTPPTPKTDDEDTIVSKATGSMRSWLPLSRRDGSNPPQIVEDLDDLPPDANTDLDILVSNFKNSDIAETTHDEIFASIQAASSANGHTAENGEHEAVMGSIKGFRRVSLPRQFLILSRRTWRNLYRNPILMLTHYAVAILLAVLSGWLFYGITDDIGGFQNRLGLFFFLLALFGFSTLTSLNVFSSERLIFVRERANGYYSPITYFLSKVIFDIVPLRLIPPIIMGIIIYPMSGLLPKWGTFFTFILILVLFNLAAAAICLTIGIIFKDAAVANLIGSLVMLFSLLFAGLLLNLNHDSTQTAIQWLQRLSIFHYGYEALIVNEVAKLRLKDHRYGLDIEVPGASILSAFGFDNLALWGDVIGLGVFAGAFIVIAYAAMHVLLVEKR